MDDLNEREQSLLAYVATISFDPRVRAARGVEALYSAVSACLREDIPAVGRMMVRGAVREGVRRVEPVVTGALRSVAGHIDDWIGSLGRSRR